MNELPQPLTPADCDLRDFAFMPLDVARLRDSDFVSLESAEDFRAGVLLWCASWHQIPAGSLPDDDRSLSKLAGYGYVVKEWQNHRAGALRGWIKCADGRLYHPVIAEKANESWYKKVRYAWEKECERLRKQNKKLVEQGKEPLPYPPEPFINSAEVPLETPKIPPERKDDSGGKEDKGDGNPLENALKGEGEGQGEGQGQLTTKEVVTPQPPEDDSGKLSRDAEIAILLRKHSIDAASHQPIIAVDWANDPKVTDDILLAAIDEARRSKPNETIRVMYLAPIVKRRINPQPGRPEKFDPVAYVNKDRKA